VRTWEEVPDAFSNSEGYTLYLPSTYDENVAGNLQYATIKDSSGQTYEFNSYGLLRKIKSAEENSENCITVSYVTGGLWIDKITDGAGREYRFSYTEYEEWLAPLLTSIQAYSPSGSPINITHNGSNVPYKITYTYEFSNYLGVDGLPILSSATYPDGENVHYTVNDSLVKVKNIDGYTIEFDFGDGTIISEKVYDETGTNFVPGGELTVSDINPYEKSFTDENLVTVTKQYDMYGRTINTTNPDGSVVARTYRDDYKAQGSVSYSMYNTFERNLTDEETNLITNSSFTTNLSGWEISSSSKVKRTTSYDCVSGTATPGSLQMSGVRDTAHYAAQTIDVDDGKSGDEYRLDYFTQNTTHSHMVAGLQQFDTIIIGARNNVEGNESWSDVAWVDANPFNDNWQKYSYSFDIDFPYNEILVIIIFMDQYGTVRFDDVSLVNTYKPAVVESSETDTENENTDTNTGTSDEIGCDCEDCITPNCPCTICSDNCALPSCNRGYSFENNSQGLSFSITDGVKTMGIEQNVNGNYYGSQKDINGFYTGYSYNQMNGQLNSMSDGNGDVTSYSYDAMSRLNKVSNDVEGLTSGNKMETSYSYKDDRIESITHNGFSYNYEYDVWGNPTYVKVGEQPLVSYTYDTNNKTRDRVNCITYGNGDYTDYDYNDDGTIKTIQSYSSDGTLTAEYQYIFGDYGQLEKIKNVTENTEIRYTDSGYNFVNLNSDGSEDDVIIYSETLEEDGKTVEILAGKEYNEIKGDIRSDAESGTTTSSTSIESALETYNFASTTDYFGRIQSKDTILYVEEGNGYTGTEKIRESYEYADSKDPEEPDRTTGLVSKYSITHGTYVETVDKNILPNLSTGFYEVFSIKEFLYDYDDNGNITRIRLRTVDDDGDETLTELYSYVYDNVGQVVRENNLELNKSFVYVYDKGGNIAQKKEYVYTTGELGEPVSTINYTYDSVWKDKLTAYGDTQIQTDAMGNPLNYKGNLLNGLDVSGTLEWNGRQLSAAVVGGARYEYTYNAEGLRTSVKEMSSNDEVKRIYYYIWENGKLMGYYIDDITGSDDVVIKMLFDDKDDPIGYEVINDNDDAAETMYFQKNLQGDITAVCNSNRKVLITYTYDAWGGVQVASMNENSFMGLYAFLCTPITYRGYMYDVFTGLYYLQSRYYNPAYGRFLNMDSIMKTGEPLGANIFAYCGNNPVNYVDYDGRDASEISRVIADALISIVLLTILYKVLDDNNLDYVLEHDFASYNMCIDKGGVISCILQTEIIYPNNEVVLYSIKYGIGTVEQWYAYYDEKNSGFFTFLGGTISDVLENIIFDKLGKLGNALEIVSIIFDNQTIVYNEYDDLEKNLRYHQPDELMFRVDMISMCKIYTDSTLAIVDLLGKSIHFYL